MKTFTICGATSHPPDEPCPPAELDATKGACPRCSWPLDNVDDTNGDGFATCPCGASVDLEAIAKDPQLNADDKA